MTKYKTVGIKLALGDAKEKVAGYANVMNEHLAKIYYMPNSPAKHGWYNSIWHSIDSMHDVMVNLPSRKRLTANEYYAMISDLDGIIPLQKYGTAFENQYKLERNKSTVLIYQVKLEEFLTRWYKTLAALLTAKSLITQSHVEFLISEFESNVSSIIEG